MHNCSRVAPDYAAALSLPILDRGRNAREREIGSSTVYTCTLQCTCVDLIIIITNYIKQQKSKISDHFQFQIGGTFLL